MVVGRTSSEECQCQLGVGLLVMQCDRGKGTRQVVRYLRDENDRVGLEAKLGLLGWWHRKEQVGEGPRGRQVHLSTADTKRNDAVFDKCEEGEYSLSVKVLFALNQTLLQHESLRAGSLQAPYTTEDLIKHYNCGDLNAVIFNHDTSQVPNFINTTLPPHEQVTAQEIDSYFRQELIYKRNERMGKRVMSLLRENRDKSFFFAFGAVEFTFLSDKSINNNHSGHSSAES
ncbi:hypothetical protein BTVI_105885 [Pitangus sulphuratus]|nr:hypothetical protein BTVI_105885 [Pitangus sulphuratus]